MGFWSCPSMGDRAQLTTQSRRGRVQTQEGYNGCVCFPVLCVLRWVVMMWGFLGELVCFGVWGEKVH